MQNEQMGGLLGSFGQQAAPQQPMGGGLLAQAGQGGQMPPEVAQMIAQMKDAPPEERQAFFAQLSQQVMAADKPENMKQTVLQTIKQGLGL